MNRNERGRKVSSKHGVYNHHFQSTLYSKSQPALRQGKEATMHKAWKGKCDFLMIYWQHDDFHRKWWKTTMLQLKKVLSFGRKKEGKKNKGTRMPYAGSLRQKWNPNKSQLRSKDGTMPLLGCKEGTWVTLCEESAHTRHGAHWTWRKQNDELIIS